MKKNNILSVLFMAFLIFGCGAPSIPTQPTVASSTTKILSALTSTSVSLPTATEKSATPTLTSEPGLRTHGPYFAYFREMNEIKQLILMDADGSGRKIVDLPKELVYSFSNQQNELNVKLVSPDGRWLAFYTGSAGSYGEMPASGTSDLKLNLLDLVTGEQQVITPILSKDYPNNFVEAAKKWNDTYITADALYEAFLIGITNAIGWSPDGQYLAFGAQLDGPSSDLYVYAMAGKTIQRLTTGPEELQWINWSSDGKWILHGSVYAYGEGVEDSIYAVTVNGSIIREFGYGYAHAWLNSHEFFEYHAQNGPGKFELRLADVNTGKIETLWEGSFLDYTFNPDGDWLVLFAFTSVIPPYEEDPNFVPGLQLINLRSLKRFHVPKPLTSPPDSFLAAEDGKIIALNMEPLRNNGERVISLSLDSKYWVMITPQEINIFSPDLDLVKKISLSLHNKKINKLVWRPDSSGLFLICGTEIYSVNITQSNINLVETNLVDDSDSTYKWINNQ